MKRYWGLILAAALLLSVLAGCGGAPSAPAGDQGSAADSSSAAEPGGPADAGDAGGATEDHEGHLPPQVQAIADRGVLLVGVKADVPKFGYKDPATNAFEGVEIDLARRIAKEILGDENKVEFTAVNAKTRGPALDQNEVDLVIATFTITEERKKSWNFSEPYFTDNVGFLVKADSGIESWKDLDGKTIGVAQAASTKDALTAQAEEDEISVKFMEFATYPEIKAALDAGRVQAFSVDQSILWGYKDETNKFLPEKFAPQEYGIASKLSNTELAQFVNDLLAQMRESGELDQLFEKWGLK